ncbi:MAG: Na+/H+ antiporter [Candidatus Dormibacteraceae bacterium]
MSAGSPAQIGQILLLLAGAVAVTAVARKKGWPAPPLVVAVGLVISLIPGVPQFQINPQLLLGVVLPPLLYSATLESSAQDFRRNLFPIVSLGVGLVIASTLVVALVAHLLVPGLPLSVALVLGAVLAPPDAVAAVAIGRKLNLPPTVMSVLSGESLINDGSALTLYKVALAGVGGTAAYLTDGLRDFGLAIGVGLLVGLLVAVPVQWIRTRLDDPVLESVIGLIVPFGVYLIADQLQGSGVIAVVAAGLYLGHNSPKAGYASRLQEQPLWTTVSLLLEALVFGLIGLQLRFAVVGLLGSGRDIPTVAGICAAVFGVVIAVRFAWVFGVSWAQGQIWHRRPRRRLWRAYTVVSWAGMRGVVTLAAAAAIPLTAGNPALPFPDRDLILLLAFVVTVGTLLLQGLTLPVLIRILHLQARPDPERSARTEAHLVAETKKAALAKLEELQPKWAQELGADKAQKLVETTRRMLDRRQQAMTSADRQSADAEAVEEQGPRSRAARGRMAEIVRVYVGVQRDVLIRERDAGHVDEHTMRRILRDLDYQEAFVNDAWDQRL